MYTRDDLIDAILRRLKEPAAPAAPVPRAPAASRKGRVFLSEYDVKKALTPGETHLTIPKDAIVSPLAQEWLALKGIRIIRA